MKIKLYSDLHLEFNRSNLVPDSLLSSSNTDVLVLAGDITSYRNLSCVLTQFASAYKHIIYVPGNHEFYGTHVQPLSFNLPNVHVLQGSGIAIDGTHFIGATLWTNFRNDPVAKSVAREGINDFHHIKDFSPTSAELLYEKELEYIQFAYKHSIDRKKVIVTHFLPTKECTHPKYLPDTPLNAYFANDLGDYIKTLENTTWMFGHTHDSRDLKCGSTRLVCNPAGYRGENRAFDPNFIIEV